VRPDQGGRSTVYGTRGVVAAEDPRAALAGIRVLDAGGNAADACVAMAAVLAVVAPMMTGPGGDAFLQFYEAGTGRVRALEGAGAAGSLATGREAPLRGPESITVPGAVRLWADAAAELGRLPLATLLAPARELADGGFAAGEVVARLWQEAGPVLAPPPKAADLVRLPDLARTLGAIADHGPEAFYEGEIAERIVETAAHLTADDLADHRSTWVEPLTTTYHGLTVHELPPPTIGTAALAMLRELEPEDLGALDPLCAERIHLEATAAATALAAVLESPGDTVYVCAIDAEGNGCSFINSLYEAFGSGLVAPGTGVCLHNRGAGARLEPGKRPLHTLIPGLATQDGDLWAVFGNMGGFMQPQGHVQVLVNLRDHGMEPQAAVDHPRHRHDAGRLLVEGRVPEAELDKLRRWGHPVEVGPAYARPVGGAQVVRLLENGVRAGGSDPRKDGCALAQ
jgi:gamma-glutamyltranspeptidase/glutathione hydrolase